MTTERVQAIRYPTGWKQNTETGLFEKRLSETETITLSADDLKAWERANHETIRGMKLNARADAAYTAKTGIAVPGAAPATPAHPVIDLMAALKASLAKDKASAPPQDPSSLADDSAAAAESVDDGTGLLSSIAAGEAIVEAITTLDEPPAAPEPPAESFGGGGGFDGGGAGGTF